MSRDLDRLEMDARELGVCLDLERDDSGIFLINIARTTGEAGSGNRVIELLTEFADERGETIHLAVALGSERLVKLYEAHGFDLDGGGEPSEPTMTRSPQVIA